MNSPEIECILQRDSAVPGLATVLDKHRIHSVLNDLFDTGNVDGLELDYIRYKPMVRAVALYRYRDPAGVTHPLVIIAHDQAGWRKCLETQSSDHSPSATMALLPREMCSIEWFPRDRHLKQLVKLFDPTKTSKILNSLIGTEASLSANWNLQPLTYKPRRRFVAKASCGSEAMTIKCYTKEDFVSAQRNAHLVQTHRLSKMVPRTIACSSKYRIIALEWLAGETLSFRPATDSSALATQAGNLLREWHVSAHASMPDVDWRHPGYTVNALNKLVEDVCWLLPELRDRLTSVTNLIRSTLSEMECANDLIHGDFYAKQIIQDGSGLRLIDFDEIGRGHRYQDVGNFVGQLYWNAVSSQELASPIDSQIESYIESFLKGYEPNTRRQDQEKMHASIVMGIVRCLPHAFRRGLTAWPARMRKLLACVERWLASPELKSVKQASNPTVSNSPAVDDNECAPYLDSANIDSLWRLNQSPDTCWRDTRIIAAHMIRHKPGKRLLVQYQLQDVERNVSLDILGKTHFRKPIDTRLLALHESMQSLRPHGVIVPRVVGVIPPVGLWLQEKLAGCHVLEKLDPQLHRRVGQALAELHNCRLTIDRYHGVQEELHVIESQYKQWLLNNPQWATEAKAVLGLVTKLSHQLSNSEKVLIHRDFYFDQVLVTKEGVGLLDWDLATMGPPELDIGNYLAHLDEYGLRSNAYAEYCQASAEEFLSGYRARRPATLLCNVDIWRDLSFARLVAISQRIPSRADTTELMLRVCRESLTLPTFQRSPEQMSSLIPPSLVRSAWIKYFTHQVFG